MRLPGTFARRDKAPVRLAQYIFAELGSHGIIFDELRAGVDVVVVVVHRAVGVEPALVNLRPILGTIARGVAAFGTAKGNQHLVRASHFHLCVGFLAVHQNIAFVQGALEQLGRFFREPLF